jgi:effector-binding domain-containing protein
MAHTVETKELNPQPILSIRAETTAAEISSTLAKILPEVLGYITETGARPAGPPFTRFHYYSPDHVELEGGLPVSKSVFGRGKIQAGELPGGVAAVTWHLGHYDKLSEAYAALGAWVKEHGREPVGPPWEVYWTDPGEVKDPAEWKTEVIWPIRS